MTLKAYILLALGALVLGLAAWGYHGHVQTRQARAATDKVQTQLDAATASLAASERERKAVQETLKAHAAELARIRAAALLQKRKLDDALKAAPDWANAPLPPGVRCAASPAAPGCPSDAPGKPAG